MRRFVPALLLVALIAIGVATVWASPWEPYAGTAVWAVLLVVAASKLVAIGLAIRRSRAGD